MLSLTNALSNKGVTDKSLASEIQSYLSMTDLQSWRLTSKQAFQDTEKLAQAEVTPHSIWYHRYLANTDFCTICNKRQRKERLFEEERNVCLNKGILQVYHFCVNCVDLFDENDDDSYVCNKCKQVFQYTLIENLDRLNYCNTCKILLCHNCKQIAVEASPCPCIHKCYCCLPCWHMDVLE